MSPPTLSYAHGNRYASDPIPLESESESDDNDEFNNDQSKCSSTKNDNTNLEVDTGAHSMLHVLFQNLRFCTPGNSNGHGYRGQKDSTENNNAVVQRDIAENDILKTLDMSKIVFKDETELDQNGHKNTESREEAVQRKDELQGNEVLQQLSSVLKKHLNLGNSTEINQMYHEMAQAMLRCKIKEGMAADAGSMPPSVSEPTTKANMPNVIDAKIHINTSEKVQSDQLRLQKRNAKDLQINDNQGNLQNESMNESKQNVPNICSDITADSQANYGDEFEPIPSRKKVDTKTSNISHSSRPTYDNQNQQPEISVKNNKCQTTDKLENEISSNESTPFTKTNKESTFASIHAKDHVEDTNQINQSVLEESIFDTSSSVSFTPKQNRSTSDDYQSDDDQNETTNFVFHAKAASSTPIFEVKQTPIDEPKPFQKPPQTSTKVGKLRRKASLHETPVNFKQQPKLDSSLPLKTNNLTQSKTQQGSENSNVVETPEEPFQFKASFSSKVIPTFNIGLSDGDNSRGKVKGKGRKVGAITRKTVHKTKKHNNGVPLKTAVPSFFTSETHPQSKHDCFNASDLFFKTNTNATQSSKENENIANEFKQKHWDTSFKPFKDGIHEGKDTNNGETLNFTKIKPFHLNLSKQNSMDNQSQTGSTEKGDFIKEEHSSSGIEKEPNVDNSNNSKTAPQLHLFNIGTTSTDDLDCVISQTTRIKKSAKGVRRKGSRLAKRNAKSFYTPSSSINNETNNSATSQIENDENASTFTSNSENPSSSLSRPPSKASNQDYSGLTGRIASLRSEGRDHYVSKNYVASIHSYTSAISTLKTNPNPALVPKETLAILHGNRAAAMMMLGAYSAAAIDSENALSLMNNDCGTSRESPNKLCPESGIVLRIKLTCRMGRAYLRFGEMKKAVAAFNSTIRLSEGLLHGPENGSFEHDPDGKALDIVRQTLIDAKLAKNDVKRYVDVIEAADKVHRNSLNSDSPRRPSQILVYLNDALLIAPGCKLLHERKVLLLAKMRKWRHLAYHCEKLACEMVKLDGVFIGDLSALRGEDWIFDVGPAIHLKADYFDDADTLTTLNTNAVKEAVVRLPRNVMPFYLRSLRLEERYADASKAASTLEVYVASELSKSGNLEYERGKFVWLRTEREKLRRTIAAKEKGDHFFRETLYERSASRYASCLTIDAEGEVSQSKENAGGKLHAVLHCNRAACFMALKKYAAAIKECSAALAIESRYMKAILRRARCHARERQYQESMNDFKKWIHFVEDARKSNVFNNETCAFDKASDITVEEKEKVNRELLDVKQAMRDAIRMAQAEAEARVERERMREKMRRSASASAGRSRNSGKWEYESAGNGFFNRGDQNSYRRSASYGDKEHTHKNAKHNKSSTNGKRDNNYGNKDKGPAGNFGSPGSDLSRCHYEVLQISKNCNTADIKKAYRKMALKYHPDKNNQDPLATDVFRRVKLAYEVLSDEKTRRAYDMESSFRWSTQYNF